MRLHRLRMTALGPYATEQVIDFDRLAQGGLFLLEGPTGAGKSTVLFNLAMHDIYAGEGVAVLCLFHFIERHSSRVFAVVDHLLDCANYVLNPLPVCVNHDSFGTLFAGAAPAYVWMEATIYKIVSYDS